MHELTSPSDHSLQASMQGLACVLQGRIEQNKNASTFHATKFLSFIVDFQVPFFSEPKTCLMLQSPRNRGRHGTFEVGDGPGFQHIALSHAAASQAPAAPHEALPRGAADGTAVHSTRGQEVHGRR